MRARPVRKRIGTVLDEEIRRFQQKMHDEKGVTISYRVASDALGHILRSKSVVEVNFEKGKKKRRPKEFEFRL